MRNIISQSVLLSAKAEKLFDMFLDPETHAAITGGPAEIGESCESEFNAFGGMLSGSVMEVLRPYLIVMSWRSVSFKDSDDDSTLILNFVDEEEEGRINLIHLDVPSHDFEGVTNGWEKFYWAPWREYLAQQVG